MANGNPTVLCGEAMKVNQGAIVPIHTRTLRHNITVKHINRIPNEILFLLCLFLRLCAWLRRTAEESWMAHACFISTSKNEEMFSFTE